jgi:hypothetical protein
MWRSRLFVFTSGFVNPTTGLSGKFSFLRCIQNRASQVYRCISNFRICQKSNTLLDYGNVWMVSMSWNVSTFRQVLSCYWLRQIFSSRIAMLMAQNIISYCIHHTKTWGYSIAQLCSYSTEDWTTKESCKKNRLFSSSKRADQPCDPSFLLLSWNYGLFGRVICYRSVNLTTHFHLVTGYESARHTCHDDVC